MAPVPPKSRPVRSCAALCMAFAIAGLFMAPAPASAQQSLKFFKNYFHTGGHFAAGVALKGTGSGGLASGEITIAAATTNTAGVPAGAEVLAAFLYWQTITTSGGNGASGAKFNNNSISQIAKNLNPGGNPPCWSSGGATGGSSGTHQVKTYRADVLPFLPLQGGKRTAIGTHTVILPDSGSGNQVPVTAGASLLVIYRDASQLNLTSTVIYDGGVTVNQSNPIYTQSLLGWFQAADGGGAATFTQIVGNGQSNFTEYVTFKNGNGTTLYQRTNPFVGPNWDTNRETFTLTGGTSSASVTIERGGSSGSFDCLSWGAMILSTTVQDVDNDGIVDRLESSTESGTITDPNTGEKLPDLYAMGGRVGIKDLFIEFGMMKSTLGYTKAQTIAAGHTHQPDRAALDMVAKAFRFAPERINVHFDLGKAIPNNISKKNWEDCPTANATTWTTDCAIIPEKIPGTQTLLADGGEFIEETPCDPTKIGATTFASCLFADYQSPLPCTGPNGATATCKFANYPGTVGWKSGFRAYRDETLNFRKTKLQGGKTVDAGPDERACFLAETDTNADGTFKLSTSCQRRFARNRMDLFHYVLWAHAIGLPSDSDPNRPKNMSGIADVNGADAMIALGLWDFATGTAFMQASTFLHEEGHNLGLRHGGIDGQPNCKPNYQSVMNYLFQVRGLITAAGLAEIGLSNQTLKALDENLLKEADGLTTTTGGDMQWRTRWYAPWDTSFVDQTLTITKVSKRCNGSPVEGEAMARVDGQNIVGAIDWSANGSIQSVGTITQDLNFSGSFVALNQGVNDWNLIRLRELGGRRNVGGWSDDSGFWDTGFWDTGATDPGFWDTGFWDTGFWDTGFWDTGFWDSGFWDTGAENDVDVPIGELQLDTAAAVGNAPGYITAEKSGNNDVLLKWIGPNVGAADVDFYEVYRLEGSTITTTNLAARVPIGGNIPAPATPNVVVSVLDTTSKNNVTYLYIVLAQFKPVGTAPAVRSGIAVTAPFIR